MNHTLSCPSCGTGGMEVFYELGEVPANSCIILSSPAEGRRYPCGTVRLAFCSACGFVSNMAFDATLSEYSERYEGTQDFSPTFRAFHKVLAERLIARYGLRKKHVVEIGCGKGEFLHLLCTLGENVGLGFDPGYDQKDGRAERDQRVTIIQDFFSEAYAERTGDFLCCKMTLEHIHPVGDFLRTVRRSVKGRPQTVLFFQVPEATRILHDCAFEDIYYEHCSYFTPGSLGRLFRRHDFSILHLGTEYDGQYLTIEARLDFDGSNSPGPEQNDLEAVKELVATFPERCRKKLGEWRRTLSELHAAGRKVVLWGSGSKAVAFLAALDPEGRIEHVVDINPRRQGSFMAGSAQQIVGPDFLPGYQPDAGGPPHR